jgi:NAD(P)H dehydrogenase (quinone)
MKILAVLCHPIRQSSCGKLFDAFIEGASDAGHEVRIADLYAEGFQPALAPEDYAQFEGKPMPADVLAEQARVEWAEALVLVFPVWWWAMPAMLKGWIDRVFSFGWAWNDADDPAATSLHLNKVLLIASAGSSERVYRKYGYDEAMRIQIDIGTLGYWGLKDARTHIFHGIGRNYEDGGPNEGSDFARRLDEARELGRRFEADA